MAEAILFYFSLNGVIVVVVWKNLMGCRKYGMKIPKRDFTNNWNTKRDF